MKYILIFYTIWVTPQGIDNETITQYPFDTMEECHEAAHKMWAAVRAEGAVAFEAYCEPIDDEEVDANNKAPKERYTVLTNEARRLMRLN